MPIKEETLSQNTSRQHPVPQNVMDVEFKVVGELTIRQLMYLFFGAALAYVFWKSGLPSFWRVIFSSITAMLSVAVAFVPFQERSLDKWLISFVKAMVKPSQMVWRKSYSPPAYFLADYATIIRNEIITLTPAKSRNKLDEYLGQLPEGSNDLDALEIKRVQNLQAYYSQSTVNVPEPDAFKPLAPSMTGEEYIDVSVIEEAEKEEEEFIQKELDEIEISEPPKIKSKLEQKQITAPKPVEKTDIQPEPQIKTVQSIEIKKDEAQAKEEFIEAYTRKPDIAAGSLRDRPMVNLPKEMKGEITIRTTTRLPKVIVEQNIKGIEGKEAQLENRVGELVEVMQRAKELFAEVKKKEDVSEEHHDRIEFFKTKYKELEDERTKISSQLEKSNTRVTQLGGHEERSELEEQVTELTDKNINLKEQLEFIQQELKRLRYTVEHPGEQMPGAEDKPALELKNEGAREPKPEQDQAEVKVGKKAGYKYYTKDTHAYGANIIHGIVKDKSSQLAENAVVIIKDKYGDAIKALKTNMLGQFRTQTPVLNGKYTVEVIKGGEKFDIISIDAKGEPLDAIYIIGT